MKAVLLAAGRGTRLGHITEHCPKPLVPVGGTTPLGMWLEKLDRYGFEEILVNAHYLADQIENFVHQGRWASTVRVIREDHLLGTAGSIRAMLEVSGISDSVVVHADNFFVGEIGPLLKVFRERSHEIEICMYTFECEDPSEVGVVETDSQGIITKYSEKDPNAVSRKANAAIFVVSKTVIESLTNETDFSAEVIPKFIGRMRAVPLDGVVIDIGSPERLEHARRLASESSNS